MNTERITATAYQLVDGFDSTAHRVVEAWLEGHERFGAVARQRWDSAFEQSKAQLDAETRKNAQHARKVIGGYYTRGVEMTASVATIAIDTTVQAARVAIDRATSWQSARA